MKSFATILQHLSYPACNFGVTGWQSKVTWPHYVRFIFLICFPLHPSRSMFSPKFLPPNSKVMSVGKKLLGWWDKEKHYFAVGKRPRTKLSHPQTTRPCANWSQNATKRLRFLFQILLKMIGRMVESLQATLQQHAMSCKLCIDTLIGHQSPATPKRIAINAFSSTVAGRRK